MIRSLDTIAGVLSSKQPAGQTRDRIYQVVRTVPVGQVATYGQIATIVECTPRQVGYALAALEPGSNTPWQRIINREGRISIRSDGQPDAEQRSRLQREGVVFDIRGAIDLAVYGWSGPSWDWLLERGLHSL